MSVDIIQEKLNSYNCRSEQEEENAVREITQEIVLGGLSRAGFFKTAGFHGGTCLRILYSLQRFSEDLDFTLDSRNTGFKLDPYLKGMTDELKAYGLDFNITDRVDTDQTVRKQFLKDDSLVKLLSFQHLRPGRGTKSIKIKIEVDTNPPSGSELETKFHDFPFPYEVTVQNLPSLFAGKNHALLCRTYIKGRDWYDFIWYVSRNVQINFHYLSAAINQSGPWKGQGIEVDKDWYLQTLKERIETMDFAQARKDVERFVKPQDLPSLELWSTRFFLDRLEKLAKHLLVFLIFTVLLSALPNVCGANVQAGLKAFESQDYATALKEWHPLAEQGDSKAQYLLGVLYAKGQGVPQDFNEALKWYKRSADQSYPAAQHALGLMYENGNGVTADYPEAIKWYRLAADQNFSAAQNNLGLMYYDGRGVKKDYHEAVTWLQLAADQDVAQSQFLLGWTFYKGLDGPVDLDQAKKWFERAAGQGLAQAQNTLGLMYFKGEGVARNYEEAFKYFELAAEQGVVPAQNKLGMMYEHGRGVSQDYAMAYKWYLLGELQGHKMAEEHRVTIKQKLTPEQIEKAHEFAREWAEKHGL